MNIATVSEIKKELKTLPPETLMEICLKLAKYKKENKELLNYILFESLNEVDYIDTLKMEMAEQFDQINTSNMYFAKKSIRKIYRILIKHIRYSGKKETQIELLISFCQHLRDFALPISNSRAMVNLYERQIKNIKKAMDSLEEDLQYDYLAEFESLTKPLT